MLFGYSLSLRHTNVNKTHHGTVMEADIRAMYYGMSVKRSVKI